MAQDSVARDNFITSYHLTMGLLFCRRDKKQTHRQGEDDLDDLSLLIAVNNFCADLSSI